MAKDTFIIQEFKKYKVFLNCGSSSIKYDYAVHLELKGGKAIIRFKSGRLKKNTCSHKGKKALYEVYCPTENYAAFIDLLRNEKPLYFYHNLEDHSSYITTSDEPVGEGE